MGAIKSNLKREDWSELWPKTEFWYCSSSSLIFSEMTTQEGYFAGAFSAFNVHQNWQILHANDPLQFLYNPYGPFRLNDNLSAPASA